MRTIALLASILVATSFLPSLEAEEVIKDKSPNGKFAMRLTNSEEGVTIELIEVGPRKAVLELAESGRAYAKDSKLLWSGDSIYRDTAAPSSCALRKRKRFCASSPGTVKSFRKSIKTPVPHSAAFRSLSLSRQREIADDAALFPLLERSTCKTSHPRRDA